jgi:translation initiation factor 3 subunit L
MYESGWNRITQQYYSNEEWPEGEVVSGLVGGGEIILNQPREKKGSFLTDSRGSCFDGIDQLFLTLYRELYFRHVYAKLEPNVDDRFQSYENICELFNLLLSRSWSFPLFFLLELTLHLGTVMTRL